VSAIVQISARSRSSRNALLKARREAASSGQSECHPLIDRSATNFRRAWVVRPSSRYAGQFRPASHAMAAGGALAIHRLRRHSILAPRIKSAAVHLRLIHHPSGLLDGLGLHALDRRQRCEACRRRPAGGILIANSISVDSDGCHGISISAGSGPAQLTCAAPRTATAGSQSLRICPTRCCCQARSGRSTANTFPCRGSQEFRRVNFSMRQQRVDVGSHP
jgi:hypothetical protein